MLFVPIIAFKGGRIGGGNEIARPPKGSALMRGAMGAPSLQQADGHSLIKCESPLALRGISYYPVWRNKACSRGPTSQLRPEADTGQPPHPGLFPDPIGLVIGKSPLG